MGQDLINEWGTICVSPVSMDCTLTQKSFHDNDAGIDR